MDNDDPPHFDFDFVGELTLQVVSDVHLELRINKPVIKPVAKILALCGDIGDPTSKSYTALIKDASMKFQLVIVIPGNHEYYNCKPFTKINEIIQGICDRLKNVRLLLNSSVMIRHNGKYIRFFGSTLWTCTRNCDVASMSDYSNIIYDVVPRRIHVTREIVSQWHETAVAALKNVMSSDVPLVVLTHHLPSFRALPPTHSYSAAYATDLEYLMKAPIFLWIHGHYHEALDYVINNVKVYSHPMRYTKEKTGYHQEEFLELTSESVHVHRLSS